ncbi:MAG: GH25 family lysozyme [Prevotellaceae bacterium]|nr:hypothetical protein [Prevotella sp.]MDD7257623.1 GH25 family lysozyme [Prevotellaceae bacterium]MDY6131241.1 GH25 family lysozyme [Prevotella sp.]
MENDWNHKKIAVRLMVALLFLVLIALLALPFIPSGEEGMKRSVALVEYRGCYALDVDGKTVLYISDIQQSPDSALFATDHDSLACTTVYLNGCWSHRFWFFPSCHGRILTASPETGKNLMAAKANRHTGNFVAYWQKALADKEKNLQTQIQELNYYLDRNRVIDAGYNTIASYAALKIKEKEKVRQALAALGSIKKGQHIHIRPVNHYTLIYTDPQKKTKRMDCRLLYTDKESGLSMVQTHDKETPNWAKAQFFIPLKSGLCSVGDSVTVAACFGTNDKGFIAEKAYPSRTGGRLTKTSTGGILESNIMEGLAPTASPVFNKWGIFVGMSLKGSRNGKGTAYYGERENGKPTGYGILVTNDSTAYAGQWEQGRRQGFGRVTDSSGRQIDGIWNADTLVRGVRTGLSGTYKGEFNRFLMAAGHGIYTDKNHYYDGLWANDKRNMFGFSIDSLGRMRVGEWKNDRYRGERLLYTAQRVYGIDISRYQHDIGRKHYPIHWNQVRIVQLGTISKKRVQGAIGYPVSFCYIKSTEGTSVLNRYYTSDYETARKQGIRCGAYHFFSTKSSGAAQAKYFLKHSRFKSGDLPPVLDVEPSHSQIRRMGGSEAMFNSIRTWMAVVEKHTGTKPILYIGQDFVNRYLPEAPDIKQNYQVWIARYGEYKPDVKLAVWQLSPDGRVRGIRGDVDINVFNGYRDDFELFLEHHAIK